MIGDAGERLINAFPLHTSTPVAPVGFSNSTFRGRTISVWKMVQGDYLNHLPVLQS